jgi:ubiquinone/menaquinone biosynthesis C-methylase UbiE
MNNPHDRRYNHGVERLRDPERVARMEVQRVADLSLEGIPLNGRVLDIGCGSGLFAEEFARRGLAVTGLDANPEMLTVARQFAPSANFQEGTAEKLPFEDGSFDLVFMGLLLHEADDISAALIEAHRVTRGRLVVLEWPKEQQEFGPPPDHRLDAAEVVSHSKRAGFLNVAKIPLTNLVLYRMDR